ASQMPQSRGPPGSSCFRFRSRRARGLPAYRPRISRSLIQVGPELWERQFELGRILDRDLVGEAAFPILDLNDRHRVDQIDMGFRRESRSAPQKRLLIELVKFR